jgi:hypothetical protein
MAEVDGGRPADVEVRQVWVHGDYMKAIDPRVLSQALLVQNALIGRGFGEEATDAPVTDHTSITSGHGACYATERSCKWGYHSPLLYWNSSLDAIEQDVDLLATINSQSTHQSALNLTLRPSTVFAGKSFSNQRLRAADALVITLFDQTNSSLGYTWEVRSRQLAEELSPQWSLFPEDGQITTSRLYEFHFKPMTIYDDLLLTISYVITVAYVIWRMLQLRAVKSRAGLLVTVCVKVGSLPSNAVRPLNRLLDDDMPPRKFHHLCISRYRPDPHTPPMVSRRHFLFWTRKHVCPLLHVTHPQT